jgi:cytochrome d ubiquinol oxidase subunit II
MLIEGVAFFLAVSLLFYCLFAGADFGAGILEAFRGKKLRDQQREIINRAISPVWEANHVWLILAVVILFVGFPKAYAQLSITYHIPLTIMLMGIVLRGCAFTFRRYDAVKDNSQTYYSALFVTSSFITPLMLGTIAGAVFLGRIPGANPTFASTYLNPWLNVFSFSVGIFAGVLFAFLAAVYLIGESSDFSVREIFKRRARALNVIAIVSGVLVFMAAEVDGLSLITIFTSDAFALACMALASVFFMPLWFCIWRGRVQWARVFVASQVGLILLGWLKLQFPSLMVVRAGSFDALTIYNTAAPEATLRFLMWALLGGSALIFPALIYLMIVFKRAD